MKLLILCLSPARDVGRGQAAVAELEKEGLKPKFHQLDISNTQSITLLRDYLKEKYGGLDLLVNNAAVAYKVIITLPSITLLIFRSYNCKDYCVTHNDP